MVISHHFLKERQISRTEFNISTIFFAGGPISIALRPPDHVYVVAVETPLPTINCTAECNPACLYSWSNNSVVVSSTRILTLGSANSTTEGAYICTATREGTSSTQSISITVKLKAGKYENVLNSI